CGSEAKASAVSLALSISCCCSVEADETAVLIAVTMTALNSRPPNRRSIGLGEQFMISPPSKLDWILNAIGFRLCLRGQSVLDQRHNAHAQRATTPSPGNVA